TARQKRGNASSPPVSRNLLDTAPAPDHKAPGRVPLTTVLLLRAWACAATFRPFLPNNCSWVGTSGIGGFFFGLPNLWRSTSCCSCVLRPLLQVLPHQRHGVHLDRCDVGCRLPCPRLAGPRPGRRGRGLGRRGTRIRQPGNQGATQTSCTLVHFFGFFPLG